MLASYKNLIENNPVAFATVDEENRPNVIAVADVKVVSADEIVIADNYMTKTAENLKKILQFAWQFGTKNTMAAS